MSVEFRARARAFLDELKRRRVIRVAVAYCVAAFVVAQVATTFFPALHLPDWTVTLVVALCVLGLPVALVLAWAFDVTDQGIVRATHADADVRPSGVSDPARAPAAPRSWPRMRLVKAGSVVLLLALIIGLLSRDRGSDAIDSVAVLPLANFSGDPHQEYLADGMTDELITALGQIEALRVISRTSVMPYKETRSSLSEIGRTLAVAAIVEGSLRVAGERVEIRVRLLDAATERRLWEDSFERDRRDLASMRQEVAQGVARALGVAMTTREAAQLAEAPRVDPLAFDLYLRGTQARHEQTPDSYAKAQSDFEQAIARDSAYAPAYAGLASVRLFSGDHAGGQRLAEKAIALDSSLADPHIVLGLVRQYAWDWEGAEAAFRHAIELDPGHAEAHHELSMHLMRQQRFDEALREARHTLYLAPMAARFQHGLGEVLLFSGRYEEALVAAERTLALGPSYEFAAYEVRGIAYAELGRYREAVEWLQKCTPVFGDECRGWIGYSYAASGNRQQAMEVLDELKARWENGSSTDENTAYGIAMIHANLGERDQALDWLERSPMHRMVYIAIDPSLVSLHAEPRFRALLTKAGLGSFSSRGVASPR